MGDRYRVNDFIVGEDGLQYIGGASHIVVPDTIEGRNVERIAPNGFSGRGMKSISLPAVSPMMATGTPFLMALPT